MADSTPPTMTSTKPYLVRAMYDWIVDNHCTPHLLVEVKDERTQVPRQYVENGVIVLNVSPSAVRDLALGDDTIRFSARFAGKPHDVSVPITAVQAIYARENGQGIFLGDAEGAARGATAAPVEQHQDAATDAKGAFRGGRPPHLTVVK
jgi:stringent starvation protein B